MNIDDNGEIRPELIERLKEHIPDSDWKQLENHLKEESKLGLLRKEILSKLEKQQRKIDQEWAQASVREKSEMIGEMQSKLYELQLVEHAAKKPLLEITKILISANPNRCVQRETNPAKLKPAKRRKNELGGLINNSNSAEDMNSALKRTSTREAKLYANSQVHQQHEERVISGIDEPEPKMVGPGRRGKRRGKSLVTTTTNGTISRAASPIPAIGEKEDEQQPNQGGEMMDEDDRADSINLAIPSPTIDEADCQSGMASANSPIRSPIGELGGGQDSPTMTCMSSPTTTLGTRGARKRGRETAGSAMREMGIAGTLAIIGRSPRKRIATERHRNSSENIGTSHRGGGESVADEEEDRVPISVDEPTYCLCEQVSFGEMICCDNELCSVEWFHFACVSIKSKPKGKKWYCPLCRHNEKPNQLKPELQQKLDQMKKAQGQ